MGPKKKSTKVTENREKKAGPSKCSSRQEPLTVDYRTKTKTSKVKITEEIDQKGLQNISETFAERRKGPLDQNISKETKQTIDESEAKKSKYISTENTCKQIANTVMNTKTNEGQVPGIKTSLKRKQKRIDEEQLSKMRKTVQNESIPKEIEHGKPQLIKTIRIEQNHYGDASITRYCDVTFLDDHHILALDDNFLRRKTGQRICCISLDGTLVCDLPVSGYPWSVAVLSQTETIVTMREHGLIWISIDILNKTMEITRRLPLEAEVYGISYSDRSDTLFVSYQDEDFMSVLNREGVEKRKIRCNPGAIYRCLVLQNNMILYLNHQAHTVGIMDQRGELITFLRHRLIKSPNSLVTDRYGNIYVGCFDSGIVLKFDRKGRHLRTFKSYPCLSAFCIDRTSERIVFASKNSIYVYTLYTNT